MDDLFARVEDQEAAGAVGVLGFTGLERRLAEGGRLLVTEDAGHRDFAEQLGGVDRAVDLGGGFDGGHHAQRDPEDAQDFLVPGQGVEVHEQGAGGVGDVRDMDSAVHPAGQVPEDPRVRVAEDQVTGLCLGPGAINVVQDPLDLGAGKIGGQRKAHLLLEPFRAAILRQLIDDVLRAGVLPDDGVVDGFAGGLVPHHGGFALVGNSDGGNVVTRQVRLGERRTDDLAGVVPDLGGVVLHPAGLREDLLVLHLAG